MQQLSTFFRQILLSFFRQVLLFLLSALHLSRGKRLLIVTICYGLAIPALWFLYPRLNNGASMLLPIISACWLFRYRGLFITLVLDVVAMVLVYLFLLPDI